MHALAAAATGKRIFQMLEVVPDLGCDEACKYIKSRVQRAWEVCFLCLSPSALLNSMHRKCH